MQLFYCRGHSYTPRARGVQVQTSPPRLSNVEGNDFGRNLKSIRGVTRGGRGGWSAHGLEQR